MDAAKIAQARSFAAAYTVRVLSTDDRRRTRFWRPDTPSVTGMLRVEREDRTRITYSEHFMVVVAQAVGYCDESQLHRHFRRIVGVTPGAYAKSFGALPRTGQHRPSRARGGAPSSTHEQSHPH